MDTMLQIAEHIKNEIGGMIPDDFDIDLLGEINKIIDYELTTDDPLPEINKQSIDKNKDLLDAYRIAFAIICLQSKLQVLKAMESNDLGGAAMAIKRDFGFEFAEGLRRSFNVDGYK